MNNGATEHSKTQARKGPDVKRHLHILVAYTSDLWQPIITKEQTKGFVRSGSSVRTPVNT